MSLTPAKALFADILATTNEAVVYEPGEDEEERFSRVMMQSLLNACERVVTSEAELTRLRAALQAIAALEDAHEVWDSTTCREAFDIAEKALGGAK